MRQVTFLVVALLLLTPVSGARADDPATDLPSALDGISGSAILEMVTELAAEEMKGRKTGFEGGGLVERYVAGKLVDFGLDPADRAGVYLEPFRYPAQNTEAPIAMQLGDAALTFGADYVDLGYTGGGEVWAEVVFCGYGIHRPDEGLDDYAGVDVKGKIVMAIRGTPTARAADFHDERQIGSKSSTAADQGAAGFILVQGDKASSGTIQARFHRSGLPAVWASRSVADRVLAAKDTCLADEKQRRDEGQPGASFATGVKVRLDVKSTFLPHATGNNALGLIKGRDEELSQEVVLLTAHMDHLGVGPTGEVYNGADDNASGTAVMLHLVDVLTRSNWRPKRTIVFCGFGAEEQGLHGSRALVTSIPFPCRGIACVLNMDMVGQGEPKIGVSGVGAFPEIARVLETGVPPSMKDAVTFSPRSGPSGDHWPFHELGVPAFFIATKGKHPNYHTPADDVANIKPEALEAAAKAVGAMLVAIGEYPEPLLDPQAFWRYVTREGPRFAPVGPGLPDELLADGVTCVVRDVSAATIDAAKVAWDLLAKQAEEQSVILARSGADIERAWRAGRMAWLPRLFLITAAGHTPLDPDDPETSKALREIGFVLLGSPGGVSGSGDVTRTSDGEGDDAPVAPLGTLIGGAGPVLGFAASVEGLRKALDEGGVVVTGDTEALIEALVEWSGSQQDPNWWLGGSPVRTRIRAALGGRLMGLLRGLDR